MTVAVEIALLAILDALLSGFRAAAGREGRIGKETYYAGAIARGAIAGIIVVAVNAALTWALVASAPEPAITWRAVVDAGALSVSVFRFAALVAFLAIFYWFAGGEVRIVPTLLVLGPLTLLRPLVIAGVLLYAVWPAADWRVWMVAFLAGGSMLGIEWILGLRYRNRWRFLV
jgi:hypothetical protein